MTSPIDKEITSCWDIVFIVTSNLDMYAIPSTHIDSARQISLNKYADYQVKFIAS